MEKVMTVPYEACQNSKGKADQSLDMYPRDEEKLSTPLQNFFG